MSLDCVKEIIFKERQKLLDLCFLLLDGNFHSIGNKNTGAILYINEFIF